MAISRHMLGAFLKGWDVLLVEDEPNNLIIATLTLRFYGATVHTARDGLDALEKLETLTPHFILSDISMPEMNGWELLEQLQATPSTADIPIFAFTAHTMAQTKEKALAAGFHAYLTKPLVHETFTSDLLDAIRSIPKLAQKLNAAK